MNAQLRTSFLRCVGVVFVCVALNLIGVGLSREVGSILFLDLVGTAIASLVYGPVHGALVGFLSNGIGELIGFKYYFLFAPVQAVSAAAWGIIPRLLKGRWCTDFFNDGADPIAARGTKKYRYFHLFFGLLWLSLVSNVLASFTIAYIMTTYNHDLSCVAAVARAQAAGAQGTATNPGLVLCDAARLLFSESGYDFQGSFFKIGAAKALFGWPDHLIALAVAVLLVATLLPGRRYKMGGIFGRTLVTQRRQVAILFTIAFVVLSLYRINFALELADDNAVFWDLLVLVVYTNLLLLLFVRSPYKFDVFEDDFKKYIFAGTNPDLERAYEDTLKLITVLSVIIVWLLRLRCPNGACTTITSLFGPDGGDRVTGFVGVVFVITFVRYTTLITSRAGRA